MGFSGYWGFAPYVSVAEKRARAARKLQELKKKNANIRPVCIDGRTIARTWWGKAWNRNLESYADYNNRIGRGRSYVRNGAVLDLQIGPGKVACLVQGSRSQPYSVSIQIRPIDKKIWHHIRDTSQGKIGSMQELLAGKFPKELGEVFTVQGKGLFPTPKEIQFECSCPDWAAMCKHVAATLYGIGARLDEEPALFFTLRNAEIKDLVAQAVRERTRQLLQKARKTTGRIIAEGDLAEVFGIEMEEPPDRYGKAKASSRKPIDPDSKDKRAPKRVPLRASETPTEQKRPSTKARASSRVRTPFETVTAIVGQSKKGVTVADIRQKTGLEEIQIRNCITRARQKGLIAILSRGVYGPARGLKTVSPQRRTVRRKLP